MKNDRWGLVKISAILLLIFLVLIYNIYFSDILTEFNNNLNLVIKRLISFDFSDSTSGSTRYRWLLITDAFKIIKMKPFGVGAGNSNIYLGMRQGQKSLNVHNWFLELTLDFGIVFIVCYLVFYFSIMKDLYKCINTKDHDQNNIFLKMVATGCLFSHVGFIIGMASPSSIIYFYPYWVLLGLSISVINIYKGQNH